MLIFGWETMKSKKRRRSRKTKKQTTITDYWLDNSVISNKRAPTIFVFGVKNIQPLIDIQDKITPKEYTIKCLRENEVKIQPSTIENYTGTIQVLTDKDMQFRTYTMNIYCTLRNIQSASPKSGHSIYSSSA